VKKRPLALALVGMMCAPGLAWADEAAEAMVTEALPHMYHTCASLAAEVGDDEAAAIEVVGKLTAVSLYMRDIDITTYNLTEEEAQAARQAFLETIAARCGEDPDALLAGVVDAAVKEAVND
jgi:hypothetical protein